LPPDLQAKGTEEQ